MPWIDAGALKEKYADQLSVQRVFGYDAGFVAGILAALEMPTLSPPNEPLTLDELREMDGEPVWIVDVGPHKWYGPGWAIVDRDNCLVRTVKNWNAVFFEKYGERWLAYRRPKEEQ